jgi:hypothetical protein
MIEHSEFSGSAEEIYRLHGRIFGAACGAGACHLGGDWFVAFILGDDRGCYGPSVPSRVVMGL